MTALEVFGWAAASSLSVELIQALKFLVSEQSLPPRYKNIVFLILRFSLACVAGGLAVAQDANTKLLAIHIGAATPFILAGMSQAIPQLPQSS